MITREELEQIEKDCAEAKGSPTGMKLIEAGLIEKLVAEIKHLHEIMVYIHAMFVPSLGITDTAWAALAMLSEKITRGMRPKDLVMGTTQKFYDDWMSHYQPGEEGEVVLMCDPRECGVIFDDGPGKGGIVTKTIKLRERYAMVLDAKKRRGRKVGIAKKAKPKKSQSKGGLCSMRK